MKLNLPALIMVLGGSLLIYSAYIDDDPRNVIFEAIGVKRRVPHTKAGDKPITDGTTPGTAGDATVPDKGYANVPHNAQGYPLNYTLPGTTVTTV